MKIIWIWLILIIGILLVGSVTILSKNKPLLEGGYKEMITFVYGREPEEPKPIEDVTYTPSTITVNPIRTRYNGNYEVLKKIGNESLYDITFEPKQVLTDSYIDNETKETINIYRKDTIICLKAGWDSKEIITYKDVEQKEIDKNYTYSVPSKLSFYKTNLLSKQADLTNLRPELSVVSPSNSNKFCYQANPEKDFYLKFGENSIIIIQSESVVGDSLLSNITAESGDTSFTHLNISTTAPYDSLVGYWSFDGDRGLSVTATSYDFSKYNNDGTMADEAMVVSTGCIYDNCLQLDGTDDNVDVGDITDTDGLGSFSVTAWAKADSTSAYDMVVSKIDNRVPEGWMLYERFGDGEVIFQVENSVGSDSSAVWTYGGENVAGWHMLTGVYNGTNVVLYWDGVQKASSPLTGITSNTGEHLLIGAEWRDGQIQIEYDGLIDEVMIFSTSLTPAQILDIYNNQSARFVSTGTQILENQSYLNFTTGGNRMNVTVEAETNLGSNISLLLGYYDGSWSFTPAQNLTALNSTHYRGNFSVGTSTKTNWTLNFTFYAGNNSHPFYTPLLKGDIEMENWSIAVDSCSCPSSGDWHILNGDECSLSTTCNIGTNKFRVLNGKMRINSGGYIRAGGCFVVDTHSLYIEDGGGLFCGS